MKKFLTLLKISIISAFEYRGDMFIFVLSGISQPLVLMAMWLGVVAAGGNTPMTKDGFIQYYLLFLVVNLWTNAWGSGFIASKIRLGELSPYLLKPVHYFVEELAENIGEKVVKFFLILPVIFLMYFIFRPTIISVDMNTAILFLISLFFSASIIFCIDVIMGQLAFWLDEISAVENVYDVFLFLFSGRLIPVVALPKIIQDIGFYLPFRYSLSFPMEILLKQINQSEIFNGFVVQLIWVCITFWLMISLWNRGLKRYSASGA